MDSLISTFHIDWHLIVAQAINFAIVLVVLYFFALKPLKKLMEERGATIEGGLENAKLHEKLLAEAKINIEKTQVEFNRDLNEQKKLFKADLAKMDAEHTAKTKADNDKMMEDARKQMKAEKDRIIEEAEKEVGSLFITLAEKAFGSSIDEKTKAKIVEDSIKQI